MNPERPKNTELMSNFNGIIKTALIRTPSLHGGRLWRPKMCQNLFLDKGNDAEEGKKSGRL